MDANEIRRELALHHTREGLLSLLPANTPAGIRETVANAKFTRTEKARAKRLRARLAELTAQDA